MDLDKEFARARKVKEKNYGKLVQLQKKLFDEWGLEQLKERGYPGFKMSYMAFLMNIDEGGVTNKELAMCAHVSKQAMSKAMRDLEKLRLVETRLHETDARMSIISLTDKGKQMVVAVVRSVEEKTREYERLVGAENFRRAMDTMYEIIRFEKEKLGDRKFK